MIRDPSDGSVKPPLSKNNEFNPQMEYPGSYGAAPVDENAVKSAAVTEKPSDDKPLMSSTTSGLPAAAARDADRHQRSKEWLADYRAAKALCKYCKEMHDPRVACPAYVEYRKGEQGKQP